MYTFYLLTYFGRGWFCVEAFRTRVTWNKRFVIAVRLFELHYSVISQLFNTSGHVFEP